MLILCQKPNEVYHVYNAIILFYSVGKVWPWKSTGSGIDHVDEAEEAIEPTQMAQPALPDTMIFQIVAGNEQDLDAAAAAIDEFINSEFTSEVRTMISDSFIMKCVYFISNLLPSEIEIICQEALYVSVAQS